jgi:AAHS family 4-hydroxybenzoate transporter-like MFS transporter
MATPIVDVVATLDQQRVSPFQIRVATLCAAVVFFDGFDTQVIGNSIRRSPKTGNSSAA